MDYDFDLFVIGAGSGGVRAARIAASHGAKVAVAEESRVGGTCVIRGCVPKKLLMYASRFRQQFEDASAYGWQSSVEGHHWGKMISAVDAEIFRLEAIYHSLLSNAKVTTIMGRAQVAGPHRVIVDAGSRTSVDHIYAVGDVTNRLNLTPVAISEGHAFADTVFGKRPRNPDHANVPSAVFSQPPVAMVGVTEAEARLMYPEIDVYEASFRPMHAALPHRDEKVLIKLIVESATDKVVGAHMVGADAGEIIQGIAIAVKAGLTKADFDATVGIHPTIAEEFVTLRK